VVVVSEWDANAAARIRATLRAEGKKPTSRGDLVVEMVADSPPPPMKVETKIGHYTDHDTGALLDGDPGTWFWSNRALKDGDTLTWIFEKPFKVEHLELRTGIPGGTRDQILDAVLEVSPDGKPGSFRKVAGFSYGAAKADLGGRAVRAVRLRVTGTSPGWVIVQDLVVGQAED
jgi:hypothetical protein